MSEMIERVALAIQHEQSIYGPDYERLACAAMEAMREPSEVMLKRGNAMLDVAPDGTRAELLTHVHRAMIDAALKTD